ncbi:MAG: 4Fe-4S dicluster domain-containing protein, partial [Bacteroidota bacterium]
MQNGFKFNINQCVACHACVLACQIEHFDLDEIISPENWKEHNAWREVKSFNEFQFPDLPVFNFSMACNHCKEAPCMENCPALAYNSNTSFNAIIHKVDACIGCQYCTMVCPYNAPKYNPFKGVVEKCTLCLNRLKNELKTACATSCPTGALDFGSILISPQYVNGFQEFGIKPAIEITDLRKTAALKTDNSY